MRPLALAVLLAVPASAQDDAAKAVERAAGRALPSAAASVQGKPVPSGVSGTRASLLEGPAVKAKLAEGYEVNAEVDAGLAEEVKGGFAVLSVKMGVAKPLAERHFLTVTGTGLVPVPLPFYASDNSATRKPGEVRGVGRYLAVYPSGIEGKTYYHDLLDADPKREGVYRTCGRASTWGWFDEVCDAALIDDAGKIAGFTPEALAVAKKNLPLVRAARGSPVPYRMRGHTGAVKMWLYSAGDHIDQFWPTMLLD